MLYFLFTCFTEATVNKKWAELNVWKEGSKGQYISKQNCRAVTSPKKRTNEFVFLSWRLGNTWNLKSKFKFQIFPSSQNRKTNAFICFSGEITARQFRFKIYWPLRRNSCSSISEIFSYAPIFWGKSWTECWKRNQHDLICLLAEELSKFL